MNGFPVARVAGIEIRLHLSWLPVLVFVALAVALGLAGPPEDAGDPAAWIVGTGVAIGFLGSVLAHELAHALVARRRGVEVRVVTLFFFGGSASVELEATDPADERAIALAGPASSVLLGAALVALSLALAPLDARPGADASGLAGVALEAVGVVRAIALVLGVLDLMLAALNLVPAFPLDGGRLVRAIIWSRTGSERSGTAGAASVGRLAGWTVTLFGLAVAVTGNGLDGVMVVVAGWLLGSASQSVERRLVVEDLLRGMRVEQAMERDAGTIAPQLTVDTFAEQLAASGADGLAVVHDDRLLGVVGRRQLRSLARRAWPRTHASDLMVAPPELPTLGPNDALWPAVERLRRSGLDALPVMDGAALIGLLTRRGVMAAIADRARAAARRP